MTEIYTYKELLKDSGVEAENQEDINKLKKVLSKEDQKELDSFIKNKKSKSEINKALTKNDQREARLNMLNDMLGIEKNGIEGKGDMFQLADLDTAKNALGEKAYNILAKHLLEVA